MSCLHRLRTTDRIPSTAAQDGQRKSQRFFVTVNLRRRVQPFRASEFALLIDALDASRGRLGFLLCGYVLMPDHWHTLIWTGHPLTISRVVHDVKKVSARRLRERRATEGPLWQYQFWDRFVRHAKEFRERLEYMRLNPVRRGLVRRPEDWRWSSYINFSLRATIVRSCPIQIDYVHLPEQYRG